MPDYPMSSYRFLADWGGTRNDFTEVYGLDITIDVIDYHEGADPNRVSRKIPGIIRFKNIILRRAIVKGDNEFYNWINTIIQNQAERRDIKITLLNDTGEPLINWYIKSAFPVRLSGPFLNANSSNIAMEELEITHEGLVVEIV